MSESTRARLPVSQAELLEIERNLALTNFWFFCVEGLGLDLEPPAHLDIVKALEKGDFDELLILLPRGCLKSTLLCAFVAWNLVKDRNFKAQCVASTDKKAADNVFLVRQYMEHPQIIEWFGSFRSVERWGQDGLVVSGRDQALKDLSFGSVGRTSFEPGGHFELMWFDDVDYHETVKSDEQVAKTRAVDALAYPMTDRWRVMTATFWSDRDLASEKVRKFGLLIEEEVDGHYVKTYPRHARKEIPLEGTDRPLVIEFFYKPCWNLDGTALYLHRLDAREIARQKASMPVYDFNCQYLLTPLNADNQVFADADMVYSEQEPEGTLWVAVDCARSRERWADGTGIVAGRMTHEYKWHVHLAERHFIDLETLFQKLFQLDLKYPGEKPRFVIEEDGYVAGWKSQFYERQRDKGQILHVTYINAHARKQKDLRIEAMQPLFKGQQVTLGKNARTLAEELVSFPDGRYRDVADAFSTMVEVGTRARKKGQNEVQWGHFRHVRSPLQDYVSRGTSKKDPTRVVTDVEVGVKY